MAATSRGIAPPIKSPAIAADPGPRLPQTLDEFLFAAPFSFDFFQAVRLLERLYPERRPVGHNAAPRAEVVHFRAHQSLSFPPSALFSLDPANEYRSVPAMTVTFLGLTGSNGILPRHYTEMLLRYERDAREHPERDVLRDWFDLFNHRLISLFYRAWEKYRFWRAYERKEYVPQEPDPFTRCLFSLIGLGTPMLRDRLRVASWEEGEGRNRERVLARVDDLVLVYFGGFLARHPRSAISLERLLEDYFQLPVKVQQFQGQWLQLETSNQSRLVPEGGNNQLGVDTVAGTRVWDVQSKIRIQVGPLGYSQFLSFLPDRNPMPQNKEFFELLHLVRFFVGPEFDLDIQLVLKGREAPECCLPLSTADGPQLGWNSWLRSQSLPRDAADAIFEGQERVWVNKDI